jgi:FkbM family methyltransferase
VNNKSEFLRVSQQASSSLGVAYRNKKFALLSPEGRLKQLRIQTNFLSENLFFDLCAELEIRLLLECGAHDAIISTKFVNVAGRFAVAFEANPYVYARFQTSIKSDVIDYVNLGLASKPGTLQLNIPTHQPRSWSMQSSFNKTFEFSAFETVAVKVDNLDNLVMSKVAMTPSAIWIDVEGYGYSVLNGASEILASGNCKLIFIEVQDRAYWDNERNAMEICEYLSGFNFVPLVRDSPLAELYNIVFVKADVIGKTLTLTNRFWFDSSRIRPSFFDRKPLRHYLSLFKKSILELSGDRLGRIIHKISRTFGSKSSGDRTTV